MSAEIISALGPNRLMKGVFVEIQSQIFGPKPNIVPFQFNPDSLTRTINTRSSYNESGEEGMQGKTGASRDLKGAFMPAESMSMTLRLDATDKLNEGNLIARTTGIQPALSALELMMYPRTEPTLQSLPTQGKKHLYDPLRLLPLILFIMGPLRVLPVKISSMTITEQEFDTKLNPIRADVQLSLEVMTSDDLSVPGIIKRVYDYTKIRKEAMAVLNIGNLAANVTQDLTAVDIPI